MELREKKISKISHNYNHAFYVSKFIFDEFGAFA